MKQKPYLLIILFLLSFSCASKDSDNNTLNPGLVDTTLPTDERVNLIMADMSLEEKALQMVQIETQIAHQYRNSIAGIGSVLSGGGSTPPQNTADGWKKWIASIQNGIMRLDPPIPALYGIDAVHGHNNVVNTTIFPHNIGLGAANDPVLMEQMGGIVAREMFLTGIMWNFGPCVALAGDPRWGRTYESFSSDPNKTAALGTAYMRGFQSAGGIATAKHYLGDGQTVWGTGMNGKIDRGDMQASMDIVRKTSLIPYRNLVESGVKTVMVSFSSVNGEKMHTHFTLLTEILKGELGFEGFIITDWEAIQQLPGMTYQQQVVAAVNAGCDMLMEPYKGGEAWRAIVAGVNRGDIPMARVDDAVRRILTVKIDSGLMDDPDQIGLENRALPLRDPASLLVARQLVEKSMVLLKNDGNLLPIQKGHTVLVMGPGADDIGLQCGGWTMTWQGKEDGQSKITTGTTLLESLESLSTELGFRVITDPRKASEADMVLLVLAEIPYAEWEGDNPSPDLTGITAHKENRTAIQEAKKTGLPTVTLILAGRHVSIENYLTQWDAVVMAYLPGTEGDGMGRVLTGITGFSGTLPMPWYKNVEGKKLEEFEILYNTGYGLTY
jgi:beta-glucosidase